MPRSSVCAPCGDAPVHHEIEYVSSALSLLPSLLFAPTKTPYRRFLDANRSPIIRTILKRLADLAALSGILRYSRALEDAATARTKSIWKEAGVRGIEMEQLSLFSLRREGSRALLPRRPGSNAKGWEYFESLPIPPWMRQDPPSWVDDKNAFKAVFRKHGLPVARGGAVLTLRGAQKRFKECAGPVITKPRDGSRARHTTVAIKNEEELALGFRRAQQLSPFVMVEEFIEGRLYRATCVNHRLIGVIEFVKPAVVADGIHTVEELRNIHNAHKRFPSLTDVKADSWFYDAIRHQGYDAESIPPEGTTVLLSEHSERPNGGYFVDITDTVPAATVAEIERASRVSDVVVIGFDIISEDLTDDTKRFTFIEGNTLPYIEIHDIPFEGAPRNVAGAIWDLWELEGGHEVAQKKEQAEA